MYLFDPITCEKIKTDYKTLAGIMGLRLESLRRIKERGTKISSLNCYLLDDDATYRKKCELIEKEKIKDECWVDIEGTTWQISNYGRARYMTQKGYRYAIPQLLRKRLVYQIRVDDKRPVYGVARLVADYFLDKPKSEGLRILHKDDNRWNCRVMNLEWASNSYFGKRYGGLSNSIPVIKVDMDTGECIEEYESMAEAARENYTCKENIRTALDNPNKSAAGFRWIRVKGVVDNS